MSEHLRSPHEPSSLEALLACALQAHEAGGNDALDAFVAAHPAEASALREALADLHTVDLLAGQRDAVAERLGEFRLRGTLGAGGMGIVYLAEQSSLGREVALKVVRPELLFFDGARERFRREIDAVAKLEHPAIVPILATGIADGVPYYAMPRILGRSAEAVVLALAGRAAGTLRGADLRSVLTDGATATSSGSEATFDGAWWQAVVRFVHQAALGIAHAHARGVLHRDLKPSNLMLTVDGRAIVLDFGLAVARGDAKLTRTGTAAGSPAYMAPEQVRGERADERTDVYGLAATLHCLLGLRAPFAATEGEALKSQILAGARQTLAPGSLPFELRLVVDQALDVDPSRRYQSAAAFAADLQAVLEARPITARGLPAPVRLQRFARRHRVLATAVVALAAFAVALPTVLWWQQRRANELLAAQVDRSNRSAKVSVDAVQKLLAAVARDRMRHLPEGQAIAAEMLHGAIELFDELRADATQAQRAVHFGVAALARLAEVERGRGDTAAALAAARAAVERSAVDMPPAGRYLRAQVHNALIGLLLDTGGDAEVRPFLDACLTDATVLASMPEYAQRARTLRAVLQSFDATLAQRRGDNAAAERALRGSLLDYEGGDLLAVAEANRLLATFLRRQQRAAEGLPHVLEAVRIATSDSVPSRGWPVPKFMEAFARQEHGDTLAALGRDAAAVEAHGAATVAFDDFLRDYPENLDARRGRGANANNLALLLIKTQRFGDARGLLETACTDQLTVLVRTPHDTLALQFLGYHRQSLCLCLGKLGDLQALEPVAHELARMQGDPTLAVTAARSFLRCIAKATEPERAATLRKEAIELLVDADRRGAKIDLDHAFYATIRDDPKLAHIRDR